MEEVEEEQEQEEEEKAVNEEAGCRKDARRLEGKQPIEPLEDSVPGRRVIGSLFSF